MPSSPKAFVVSLTAIPSRFSGLCALLESFEKQTIQPSAIELNIPFCYRNPKHTEIPIEQIPAKFTVHRVEEDLGPATKLLPTLKRYRAQPDQNIIYLDDDRIHDPCLFEQLITNSEKHPNAAIAASSVTVKRQLTEHFWKRRKRLYRSLRLISLNLWNPKRDANRNGSRIAEGFAGILVKPRFFDETVFDYPEKYRSVDDVWISGNLAKNNIQIEGISDRRLKNEPLILNQTDLGNQDALVNSIDHSMTRSEANAACIRYLQTRYGVWKDIKPVIFF